MFGELLVTAFVTIASLIWMCIFCNFGNRKWWCHKKTRNLDEAEEDDIGPTEPATYLEGFMQRRRPLLINLRRYYNHCAAIPVHERKRAIEVVEAIKRSLQMFVKDDWTTNYTFGNILPQGSSYEGLKVIEPDEFDLLLPLMLKHSEWRCTDSVVTEYQAPGCVFITKKQGYIFNTKTPYDKAIVNYVYLSPIKITQMVQSILQRAVDNIVFPNVQRVALLESGPALTLEVLYDGSRRMSIDIVPSIMIKNKLLVAKRHPGSDHCQCRTDQNMFNNLWRVSCSENEKLIIREMDGKNECRRACLKILKTIRMRRGCSQLGMLSSYHLKTCMLHLNADRSIGSWHQDNLGYRFKDLLWKLCQFLEHEKMPSFFDPTIDLFSTNNTFQLQNIRGWLERILSSDDKIIDKMLS